MLDGFAEHRAVFEHNGLKLDLSRVAAAAPPAASIAINVGVRDRPLSDSGTTEILGALREAVQSEVIVLDLEDGRAWWETRLLVLVEGAARAGKTSALVFVATSHGRPRTFQGWAAPRELLQCLLNADHRYRFHYHVAMAASRQWALVPPVQNQVPPTASWMNGLATTRHWMAWDPSMGLPNELAPEQYLMDQLGSEIEEKGERRGISIVGSRSCSAR